MDKEAKTSSSSSTQSDFKIGKSTFIQYKKGLIEKDYKIGEVVGSGAFASVIFGWMVGIVPSWSLRTSS